MPKLEPCILAVDDDVQILDLLLNTLKKERYRVITANNGEAAVTAFEEHMPDLVLLDIMLPGIDGYAVCRHIRSSSQVPIIMLTGRGSDEEKVRGLNAGADDYVPKPFSVEELLARVRAVLRRSQATFPMPSCGPFKSGSLEIDFARRLVTVDGEEIRLTPTEFNLLQELVVNMEKVLTHSYLLKKVWGSEYESERHYLHVFVGCLRSKVRLKRQGHGAIESVPGVGYRFKA